VKYPNRKRKYCDLCKFEPNGFRPNTTRKTRVQYEEQWFDSKAELLFAKFLNAHNIQWVKNVKTSFKFIDRNGKIRKYYPDFYLPRYDYWIEIKGAYYVRSDDDLRLASVGNIELIMSNDIRLPKVIGEP
jgi:hypothetical protein